MSSSLSESIPKSSIASKLGLSSHTTSFPDLSSLSNASNKSAIIDLKRKIELLKAQIQQREKEVEKEKWEKDEQTIAKTKATNQLQFMEIKSGALNAVCEDLLKWIESNEHDEQQRMLEIENIYKGNTKSLSTSNARLKAENSYLREEQNKSNIKISDLTAEVQFLDNERKSLVRQVADLEKQYEDVRKNESEFKSKYTRLVNENSSLRKSQKNKVEQEVNTVMQSTNSQLEKVRRIHDDREKEYGITLSRLQNEIDFLKSEITRKEKHCRRVIDISDRLTVDNKTLFEANADQRIKYDKHIEKLNDKIIQLEKELQVLSREKKTLIEENLSNRERSTKCLEDEEEQVTAHYQLTEDLVEAQQKIIILEKQMIEMSQLKQLTSSEIRSRLKEKSIRLLELEEKTDQMEQELKEEREQRENTTHLLLEMGKDMRHLLDVMKTYG